MLYNKTVCKLLNLDWEFIRNFYDMSFLMYLSYISAKEFGASLRIAVKLYGNDANLKKMVAGELDTTNLSFADYEERGDHSKFLEYFLLKSNNNEIVPHEESYQNQRRDIVKAGVRYTERIEALSDEVRAMSIFSRENKLPKLFQYILENKVFQHPMLPLHLQAYKYYLERHIALDTEEDGGHDELVKHFTIDDRVNDFYEARYDLYYEGFDLSPL